MDAPCPRCRCRRRLDRTRYRPTRISGRWGPRRTRASRPATRTRRLSSSWFFRWFFRRAQDALFDAAASAVTAFGYGIHSSSTSWPSVSCEFHPQVYSEPEDVRTALLREPARMALVDGYRLVGDATVSPCGRVTIVGVSTCQSRAHLLWETGASGRPSWPSSPQPHCGDGGRRGWSGWGSTRGGLESKGNEFELSPARRREAPALDRWVERVGT